MHPQAAGGENAAPDRKDVKREKGAQQQKASVMTQPDPADPLRDAYGDAPLVQSHAPSGIVRTRIQDISTALEGQLALAQVHVRGRLELVSGKGKACFLKIRQRTHTIQAVMFVNDSTVSKGMVKYAQQLTRESIVDVSGPISVPENPVEKCTQKQVEIKVTAIRCISRAEMLPFELADAGRSETELAANPTAVVVLQDLRLEQRFVDLRTPANQAIFRLQSAVCQLFREALLAEGFQEIHTPKLIAGASEGGAAVFHTDYMGRPGCLAQSPQLYKQMAICGDFDRVFEITPVFRAEKSFTHRHLCEFTGLDLEMAIDEHYNEVLDVLDRLFVYIFSGLRSKFGAEVATVNRQYPAEPLQWLPETLRLPWAEGMRLLQEAGFAPDEFGDLTTELERELGRLVKQKYHTDFYVLYRYPLAARPFYTMPDPEDARYSNSFDVFIRGEEIISGAQRVHDPALLTERARAHDIPLESIQPYIDSFRYGAFPHGGFGVGLERVIMLFLGLDNIRKTSLFPRDPKRLTP